jgi:hypothetical protein
MESDEYAIRIQKHLRGFLERKKLIARNKKYAAIDNRKKTWKAYHEPNGMDFFTIAENYSFGKKNSGVEIMRSGSESSAKRVEKETAEEDRRRKSEYFIQSKTICTAISVYEYNEKFEMFNKPNVLLYEFEGYLEDVQNLYAENKPNCEIVYCVAEEEYADQSFEDESVVVEDEIEDLKMNIIIVDIESSQKFAAFVKPKCRECIIIKASRGKGSTRRSTMNDIEEKWSKHEKDSVLDIKKNSQIGNSRFYQKLNDDISPYCVRPSNKYWSQYLKVLNPSMKLPALKESSRKNSKLSGKKEGELKNIQLKGQAFAQKFVLNEIKSEKTLIKREMFKKIGAEEDRWIDIQLNDFFKSNTARERKIVQGMKGPIGRSQRIQDLYKW